MIISNRLSLGTSASKKLHEKRVAAYTEIVSDLYDMEFIFTAARSWMDEGESFQSYFASANSTKDQDDIIEFLKHAKKTFNKNCLVISREFSKAYATFESNIKSDPNDGVEDAFEKISSEVSNAKMILETIGRDEVDKFSFLAQIPNFFYNRFR